MATLDIANILARGSIIFITVVCCCCPNVIGQESMSSGMTCQTGPEQADDDGFQIRLANPEDRVAICQLVVMNHLSLSEDCPAEWVEQLEDVEVDYAHLFDPNLFALGWYRVAEKRNAPNDSIHQGKATIVGVAGMTPVGNNIKSEVWKVTSVSVRKEYRRRGLGRRLLKMVISDAREDIMGITRLKLETVKELMQPAWRLYESMGFQRKSQEVFRKTRHGELRPRPLTVMHYSLDL